VTKHGFVQCPTWLKIIHGEIEHRTKHMVECLFWHLEGVAAEIVREPQPWCGPNQNAFFHCSVFHGIGNELTILDFSAI
jgi:hypothetical protein